VAQQAGQGTDEEGERPTAEESKGITGGAEGALDDESMASEPVLGMFCEPCQQQRQQQGRVRSAIGCGCRPPQKSTADVAGG
jgi:hypothetical protein